MRRTLSGLVRRGVPCGGAFVGIVALCTAQAAATIPVLSPGHAYCYYFSGAARSGGMHLVAANATTIAAGSSNVVSGVGGKPQTSVFYVDCVPGGGRVGGEAYVGVPRTVLHLRGGRYTFDERYVVRRVRHLEIGTRRTFTASMAISGSVAQGVVTGIVHLAAPSCLPRPISVTFTGT